MIPRRYAWMLRDAGLMFETVAPHGGSCKLCAALERPGPRFIPLKDQAYHIARHRSEKLVNDPDPAVAMIAATQEEE